MLRKRKRVMFSLAWWCWRGGPNLAWARAIEMHLKISEEPLCMEIYRKKGRATRPRMHLNMSQDNLARAPGQIPGEAGNRAPPTSQPVLLLKQIWFFKVHGPASPKERRINGFAFFSPQVSVHNRVPTKQSYSGSVSLMGYPLEKLFGVLFVQKGLIRHLFIYKYINR